MTESTISEPLHWTENTWECDGKSGSLGSWWARYRGWQLYVEPVEKWTEARKKRIVGYNWYVRHVRDAGHNSRSGYVRKSGPGVTGYTGAMLEAHDALLALLRSEGHTVPTDAARAVIAE